MTTRRADVAALVLAGIRDQQQIARQLGVSQPTISRDLQALEAEWRAKATQDIATVKGQQDDRLETIIAALWPKVLKGDTWTIDRALAALAQKADLWGINAPAKQEIDHTITHYELDGIGNDELRGVITPTVEG